MRRLAVLLTTASVVLAACGSASDVASGTATIEGDFVEQADGSFVAPNFSLTLADGSTWELADQSTPTLITFWADWCSVCRRDLPKIDAVAPEYDGEVGFLAVAGLGSPAAAAERASEYFTSDVIDWGYDESGTLWQLFGASGTPTNVLLAADGSVLAFQPGALPDDKRAVLDELVARGS